MGSFLIVHVYYCYHLQKIWLHAESIWGIDHNTSSCAVDHLILTMTNSS